MRREYSRIHAHWKLNKGGKVMENLITAINEYSERIMRTDYVITEEEYIRIRSQLEFMIRHLDTCYDYELKRDK